LISKEQLTQIFKLSESGKSQTFIAQELGLYRGTVAKYLSEGTLDKAIKVLSNSNTRKNKKLSEHGMNKIKKYLHKEFLNKQRGVFNQLYKSLLKNKSYLGGNRHLYRVFGSIKIDFEVEQFIQILSVAIRELESDKSRAIIKVEPEKTEIKVDSDSYVDDFGDTRIPFNEYLSYITSNIHDSSILGKRLKAKEMVKPKGIASVNTILTDIGEKESKERLVLKGLGIYQHSYFWDVFIEEMPHLFEEKNIDILNQLGILSKHKNKIIKEEYIRELIYIFDDPVYPFYSKEALFIIISIMLLKFCHEEKPSCSIDYSPRFDFKGKLYLKNVGNNNCAKDCRFFDKEGLFCRKEFYCYKSYDTVRKTVNRLKIRIKPRKK